MLLLATVAIAALAATSNAAPPVAQSATATAFTNFPLNQPLQATDDGLPIPAALTFTITTLPTHGTLADPNAGPITTAPYTLAAPGCWVTYTSASGYTGPASFTFIANDGGTAPDDGDSNTATVSITVCAPKMVKAVGSNTLGQLGISLAPNILPNPAITSNVVRVAAGGAHTLAVKTNGTVWAWGDNGGGQLGDGSTTTRMTPVQVSALSNVVAVAAGNSHSLAVKSDGTVWAWGDNASGKLGDGTTSDRYTPVRVPGLLSVVAVAAGNSHSLAVKSDGTVWAWGDNTSGQLGNASFVSSWIPKQISSLSAIVAVASGCYHSMAVKADGTAWAWGINAYGQLGDGTMTTRRTPVQISSLSAVVAAAAGQSHSLALKSDGTVWTWGGNEYGQLGDGTTIDRFAPVQALGLSGVQAVAAGLYHNMAVKADETAWVWGQNRYGQLGDGTTTQRNSPVQVSSLSSVVAVAAGGGFNKAHSLALKSDGTVWAWGSNSNSQLGDGMVVAQRDFPLPVSGLPSVVAAAAGFGHNLTLKADGTVWAWGYSYDGQVGDGTFPGQQDTPVQVLTEVVAVGAGSSHSLAVKSDGTVWTWGDNGSGQLGLGTTTIRSRPTQVSDLSGVVAVTGGQRHSLAVKSDGTLWSWGNNGYGQLGDGTTTVRKTPVQVSGPSGLIAVAAGQFHSLALKSDGTVWGWGYNNYGQLGDGTTTNRSVPAQISGFVDVVAIAAGGGTKIGSHSLALRADGTVWAWGCNTYGQLGDGTTTQRSSPVQVLGLSGVLAVTAGQCHSLAVKSDGTVWAWGYNYDGELGDGTSGSGNYRSTPVLVSGVSSTVAAAGGWFHSLFLTEPSGNGAQVVGTWPLNGATERTISQIIVGFDRLVQNVSPDDLILSVGNVTAVSGSGKGPYLFTVTDLPGGTITASLGGDIASLDGLTPAPCQWTFSMLYPGDVDGDTHVDLVDLLFLVDAFGTHFAGSNYSSSCDFNCDGLVDVVDLLTLVYAFGT
jgi:alpha-tubulin suppressor-like RCC1 family protein